MYANDHEGKYPTKLEEIQQQPYSPADLKSWALENVDWKDLYNNDDMYM
jgi:hypothetical protein